MKWLLFIFISIPVITFSQTPSWQDVNIQPSIDIQEIITDSLGFLWMHDGQILYRFDGIDATSKFILDNDQITSLEYSKNNELIIGTRNGVIILYNPFTYQHETIYTGIEENPINNTYVKDQNNFLFLSYGSGIGLYHQGVLKIINIDNGLISNEVYDVVWYNNQYYIATDQGIQIVDPLREQILKDVITIDDGLSDLVITHLIEYQNELWYTDFNNHLGRIKKDKQITNFTLPSNSKISDIIAHESGIFITTNSGLYHFDGVQFKLKSNRSKFKQLQIDAEGNLWSVSSDDKLKKGNLFFQKMELAVDDIRAIEKFDDHIIIGNESGIYRFTSDKYVQVASENVTCFRAIDDYLLVGTFSQGVKIFNKRFEAIQKLSKWSTIENESVLSIYHHNDDVYISSLSGVMSFKYNNGNLTPAKSLNPIIGQAYIYTMMLEHNKLYFGTDRDGIIIWDKINDKIDNWKNFKTGEKIGSVYALTKDIEEKIWFTSSEYGLGYTEKNHPIKVRNAPNVKDEYTSLKVLKNNNLLAIRGSSIDILDPLTNHFMYFDNELGIQSDITYLNTIVTDQNQTHFVHDHNLYTYNPKVNLKIHPDIIIDQKRVNLSPIEIGKNEFNQDENNIEFDYSGSWLTDPLKITYQYKLEGFDEEWRKTKDNSVSFPKLQPGKYTFRVRASENGLFNDEPEAKYNFTIKRHIYNEWWIRVIGLGLLGFIIFKIVKQRESRKKDILALEKLNIENQFISLKNQLNPHFLFNAFNTLIGLIEEDSDRSVAFVEKMTDFYRNILEMGKTDMISLAHEKEILSQYIEILKARFNDQLIIKMHFEEEINGYKIPPMTLQLLIENAVKHNEVSSKNPLLITITQISNSITIKNKKRPLLKPIVGTKTGLKNIIERFRLVNLDLPQIIDSNAYFEIVLKVKKI